MRVLIVDDEPEVADLVARALREGAWACDIVPTGSAALSSLATVPYDAVVLDLGLPDMDGFEVCRTWRARGGKTPILMLTARGDLPDRVLGLDAGADDYLSKPFAIEELSARLRALLRRPASPLDVQLKFVDITMDPATREVRRAGHPIKLTAREYALLEYLLRNPERVVTRAQILDHVWDDNFDPVGNVVDVLVGRLRRRISVGRGPSLIHTVRGAGYRLSEKGSRDGD